VPGGRKEVVRNIWRDVHARDEEARVWAWRQLAALELWERAVLASSELAEELELLTDMARLLCRAPAEEG
jgi:hypothetical protein